LANKIVRYFSLERAVLGGGGIKHEIGLFTGVLAGAIGQWVFSATQSGKFAWPGLVAGLIASIVTFPLIYDKAGLKESAFTFVKWCVAFQNGFFWPALIQQVGQGFKAPGT
jgi:hypothetical protein